MMTFNKMTLPRYIVALLGLALPLLCSSASATDRAQLEIELFSELRSNDNARRHYHTLREMQSTYYQYVGIDRDRYAMTDDEWLFRVDFALYGAYQKSQAPGYWKRVAYRFAQSIPYFGHFVEDTSASVDQAPVTQQHFRQVMEQDAALRETNASYKEFAEASEALHIPDLLETEVPSTPSGRFYQAAKDSIDPESQISANKPGTSNGPLESNQRSGIESPELDASMHDYMSGVAYAFELFNKPRTAQKLHLASTLFARIRNMDTTRSTLTAGAAFAGWMNIVVMSAELMNDSSDSSANQLLLEAIQLLSEQMHERFDTLEGMLASLDVNLIRLRQDQAYLIDAIRRLNERVTSVERTIRRESEIAKTDELFDLEIECVNALTEVNRARQNIETLDKCLREIAIRLYSGIHGPRLNVFPTSTIHPEAPAFDEMIEMIIRNNAFGQLNLFGYIANRHFDDSSLKQTNQPNVAYFIRYQELFTDILAVAGSELPGARENLENVKTRSEELRQSLILVQEVFIPKFAKLIAAQLEGQEAAALNAVLIRLQHREGVNLSATDGRDALAAENPFIAASVTDAEITDIAKNLQVLGDTYHKLAELGQLQNVAHMTRGFRQVNDWRSTMRDTFGYFVHTFQAEVESWFEPSTRNNTLRFMGILNTDYISEQRLHFQILPHDPLALSKPADFVVRTPYMFSRGSMLGIASKDNQVAAMRSIISSVSEENIEVIIKAIQHSKAPAFIAASEILSGNLASLSATEREVINGAIERRDKFLLALHKIVYNYDPSLFYCPTYHAMYRRSIAGGVWVDASREIRRAIEACGSPSS